MAWRGSSLEFHRAHLERIAVGKVQVGTFGAGRLGHGNLTARCTAHQPSPGNVIGMNMCVNGVPERQAELPDECQIPQVLLKYRIDEKRLMR